MLTVDADCMLLVIKPSPFMAGVTEAYAVVTLVQAELTDLAAAAASA